VAGLVPNAGAKWTNGANRLLKKRRKKAGVSIAGAVLAVFLFCWMRTGCAATGTSAFYSYNRNEVFAK